MSTQQKKNLDQMGLYLELLRLSSGEQQTTESPPSIEQQIITSVALEGFKNTAQEVANEIGMGEWFRKTTAPQEQYVEPQISINWKVPDQDEVMIVGAQSGRERKIVHQWAENHGCSSLAYRTELVEPCLIWTCPECKYTFYFQEMNRTPDYGMMGSYLGSFFACTQCDYDFRGYLNFPYDEDDPVSDKAYNAVLVFQGNTSDLQVIRKRIRKKRKNREYQSRRATTENNLSYPTNRKVIYQPKNQEIK